MHPKPITVMFDGACPMCRREIAFFQSLKPLQPIYWLDVSPPGAAIQCAVPRSQLLARFHVQGPDGELLSGARAFVELWLHLPGWRWLGKFGRLPGMTSLIEVGYRGFLLLRPKLQRLVSRFDHGHISVETKCTGCDPR